MAGDRLFFGHTISLGDEFKIVLDLEFLRRGQGPRIVGP